METARAYDGSCHCGQVKFSMKISPPISEQTVIQCNCTVNHLLLNFASQSDMLIDYTTELRLHLPYQRLPHGLPQDN